MQDLYVVLGLSFIGSALGLVGGIALLLKAKISKEGSIHMVSFAAGVILAAAFLDVLPEGVKVGGEGIFVYALIGLVAFFLLETYLIHFHHHEEHEHSLKNIVPLMAVSDVVHNFIDGLIMASTYLINPKVGILVTVATLIHEIPKETGDFGVMLAAGVSKTKTLILHLLTTLASFVGAVVAYLMMEKTGSWVGPMFGITAGMFLYIASTDILPEVVRSKKRDKSWHTTLFFLFGITMIFVLTKIFPG
jgi:zinc and cadmium transporter